MNRDVLRDLDLALKGQIRFNRNMGCFLIGQVVFDFVVLGILIVVLTR